MPESADNQEHTALLHIPPPPSQRRLKIVRIATLVLLLGTLGAAVYFRDHIQDLKRYGYLAVFLTGFISNATLILPLPGLAVSSVFGGVFNPWIVGLVGGLGQGLGEITGYLAGYSGQTWVDENPTYNRLTHHMRRYGVLIIFVLALIPNPLFDLAGLAAGTLRFPFWKFLLSCTTGKVIKNILFALGGYFGIESLFRLLNGS
jgi:membrane protein YqaA with SNARE-associated domain